MKNINEDQNLSQVFSIPDTCWEIKENKEDGVVDGVNILARAVGPFFIVDGSSDNGRYYSRKLWESVIQKNQKTLEEGMLGAVGHDQEIDDRAIREGQLSHKVTKLFIDDNKQVKLKNGRTATVGMGEILVLNTDSGRNLNTYLRSGVKLATSSRAKGRYKGKTEFGENIVDEEHYHFRTFDVVVNPGVSVSQLNVLENKEDIKEDILNNNKEKEMEVKEMAEALEKVTSEKVKVTSELGEALEKINNLMNKVSELENVVESKAVHGTDEEIQAIKEELDTYKEIGSCDSIEEAYSKIDEMMDKFEEYGDLNQIEETYNKFEELVEELEPIGTTDEIKRAVSLLEDYSKFGSPNEVEDAYEKIGEFLDVKEDEKVENDTEELAERHGLKPSSALKNVLEAIGKEDADVLLAEIEEGKEVTSRYRKTSINEDENSERTSVINKSDLARLFG